MLETNLTFFSKNESTIRYELFNIFDGITTKKYYKKILQKNTTKKYYKKILHNKLLEFI